MTSSQCVTENSSALFKKEITEIFARSHEKKFQPPHPEALVVSCFGLKFIWNCSTGGRAE